MAKLRERVKIITLVGDLYGHLSVGVDGLPRLQVKGEDAVVEYSPFTIPAAWTVCWQQGNRTNILFDAWTHLSSAKAELIDAEREADDDG